VAELLENLLRDLLGTLAEATGKVGLEGRPLREVAPGQLLVCLFLKVNRRIVLGRAHTDIVPSASRGSRAKKSQGEVRPTWSALEQTWPETRSHYSIKGWPAKSDWP